MPTSTWLTRKAHQPDLGAAVPAGLDRDVAETLSVCADCGIKHTTLARDTHSGMFHETRKGEPKESPEGRRIRLAKERRKTKRFLRQLNGEHTRVRRSA